VFWAGLGDGKICVDVKEERCAQYKYIKKGRV
jgi:hypothetical protein